MDRKKVRCAATTLASVACAALLMTVAQPRVANAVEVVPSVGITRSVESGSNDVTRQWGLAFRGPIVPHVLKAELGGSYRSEERNGGLVDAKMWPITASLLVTPIPVLYAGGGVGWYHTTLEYQPSTGLDDETMQDFGVHVGGGMNLPLAPGVGLDLGGRYVFMQDQESKLVPQKFDPDFWTLSAGLNLGF